MMEAMEDDLVVGTLGARAATLEAVGDWQAMDSDRFEVLTPAGLFGKTTSKSPFLGMLMGLQYQGHVMRDGEPVTMPNSLPEKPRLDFDIPIVLIFGTSMSAGKTLSGRTIIYLLSQTGLKVVGAKLTGAARYRYVLSYADAGASAVFDFVDAGLASTVCDVETYRSSLDYLLSRIAETTPDVVVAEAGASPLEPYNGKTAMEVLNDQIKFELLCAQDPYAVLGVKSAFARDPDLVAGGAANTSAGIELVHKLTGLPALNLLDSTSHAELATMLGKALNLVVER
ncbi:MAG: hypothetical protein QGF90_06245 [Gammaproteobacteria bacterium]|jgi:hypothetical protein|nr:hypothetical protein [Gammaproteobacteria bacterium]